MSAVRAALDKILQGREPSHPLLAQSDRSGFRREAAAIIVQHRMIRLLADENFNNDIARALVRRMPDSNVVRAQDIGLRDVEDERVLCTRGLSTAESSSLRTCPR
jgi:hypothetical protein